VRQSTPLDVTAARIRAGDASVAFDVTPRGANVTALELEALVQATYSVERDAQNSEAERREQALVLDYSDYLRAQAHSVVRHRYDIDGCSLFCDLFDETTRVLYVYCTRQRVTFRGNRYAWRSANCWTTAASTGHDQHSPFSCLAAPATTCYAF
jgi:hypothetical protein